MHIDPLYPPKYFQSEHAASDESIAEETPPFIIAKVVQEKMPKSGDLKPVIYCRDCQSALVAQISWLQRCRKRLFSGGELPR